MNETIIDQIKDNFSSFSGDIKNITNILSKSPASFNPQIWEIIQSIFNILLPVGYSLIALFFIIDFLNKSIMFEYVKWENIVKSLLKLVVAKMIIENSFELLNIIFKLVASMLKVTANLDSISEKAMDIDKITKAVEGLSGFPEQIGFYLSLFPMLLVMKFIKIAIYVIVYGRIMEVYLLTAVAPLPLSTISSEGMQSTAKRFLQTYVATCLQGLIILIACMIYAGMMVHVAETADIWESIKNELIMSLVLLLLVGKSGTWARQVVGIM